MTLDNNGHAEEKLDKKEYIQINTGTPVVGYETSTDYELLYKLAHSMRVICIVDYGDICRDIVTTHYDSYGKNIGAGNRGYSHIWAKDKKSFIQQCKKNNLEFIIPNQKKTS